MKKVFLITFNEEIDFEFSNNVVVYANLADAKKRFAKEVKIAKKDATKLWGEDLHIEKNEYFISLYKDGEFTENHINIELREEDVL